MSTSHDKHLLALLSITVKMIQHRDTGPRHDPQEWWSQNAHVFNSLGETGFCFITLPKIDWSLGLSINGDPSWVKPIVLASDELPSDSRAEDVTQQKM